MSLSRRDLEILSLVSREKLTLKKLASIFKISDRNIRYSIENLNYYLYDLFKKKIIITSGEIFLEIDNEMLKIFCGDVYRNDYIFSKEEREEYILLSLLFTESKKYIQLEEYLQVSITTLKKDMKNLRDFLDKFQLFFSIKDGILSINGNEKKLRHLKMIFALKYVYFLEGKTLFIEKLFFSDLDLIKILKEYLKNKNVNKYFKILEKIEKDMNVSFEKEFRKIILLYLIVTYERIDKGIILDKKNNSNFLKETSQYKIISKNLFKKNIEKYRYEALHLTEYFLSGLNSETFYENRFSIETFVYKLLKNVGEKINIFLEKDNILIEETIEYLTAAIYRIKNNFILNKELNKIDENNPIKIYVKESVSSLKEYLVEPLRDEEINSIIDLIEKSVARKKSVAIDLSRILEIISKNSKDTDLSTIGNEILNMYPTLINDDRSKTEELELLDVLDESRIKLLKNISLTNAISIGCDSLYEHGFVNKEYKDGVLELLSSNGHSYFPKEKVTICYGKKTFHSKKIGMCFLLLENDLDTESNFEFIILISNTDKEKHLKIMSQIKYLMDKDNFFKKLEGINKENKIMKALEESF